MISQSTFGLLGGALNDARTHAQKYWDIVASIGDNPHTYYTRTAEEDEARAADLELLIEVARLLNSDEKFRDALGEARGRKADADMQRAEAASDSGEAPIQCGECGERAEIMHYGKYLCIPCYEIANAAQFGPTDPQEQLAAMADAEDGDCECFGPGHECPEDCSCGHHDYMGGPYPIHTTHDTAEEADDAQQ